MMGNQFNNMNNMNNMGGGFGGGNRMTQGGQLCVKPMYASITGRDTETFGSMDPYLKVRYPKHQLQTEKRTRTHSGGGKNPQWNGPEMRFQRIMNENYIWIDIMDEDGANQDRRRDTVQNDDTVGYAQVPIMKILNNQRYQQIQVPIYYRKNGSSQR